MMAGSIGHFGSASKVNSQKGLLHGQENIFLLQDKKKLEIPSAQLEDRPILRTRLSSQSEHRTVVFARSRNQSMEY